MIPLRLFLSSTFRDMQGERDVLARLVLPPLRRRLEARGAALREVDLRWGVTAQMARDGGAVTICLRELEACAPMIFGMVGHRAGWQPAAALPPLFPADFAGSLASDASITEMELRYAVWLARAGAGSPFPVFLRSERLSRGGGWIDRDTETIDRIRRWLAAEPMVTAVGYDSLEAFGQAAGEHLAALLDRLAQSAEAGHRGAARPLTRIDRPNALRAISRAAGRGRPALVVGPPGAGVSWLLRSWIEDQGGGHAFDGRAMGSGQLEQSLSGLAVRPAGRAPGLVGGMLGDGMAVLLRRFLLAKAPAPILIDHFESCFVTENHADLSWLPGRLWRDASLVVAARSERLVRQARQLGWNICHIAPVSREEGARFAIEHLGSYAKTLTAGQAERLAAAPWAANLGTLILVLDELRRFGELEQLDARLAGLCALHEDWQVVDQLVAGIETVLPPPWPGAVRDSLAALAISLRGMAEHDIRRIAHLAAGPPATANTPGELPLHLWSAISIALASALTARDGVTAIGSGSVLAWLERQNEGDPARLSRVAEAMDAVLKVAPEERAVLERPRIAMARDPEGGLEALLASPAQALDLLRTGETFADGWMALLAPEARARVMGSWQAASAGGANSAVDTWRLGLAAARNGDLAAARFLLERTADTERQADPLLRTERDAMLARLTRNRPALRAMFQSLGPKADDEGWNVRILTVLAAQADGLAGLAENEEARLVAWVSAAATTAAAPQFTVQARIQIGQLSLGRARFREASRHFAGAEETARALGHAPLLCQALERRSAVSLELHRFDAARMEARECRELSERCGLAEFEALAFERLIEVEERRANWPEAFALVQHYIRRCRQGIAPPARALKILGRLERPS